MKAKLIEFFQSIQGEGQYAGVKQVFVRFFECNIHCVWCDTPHSIGDTTRRYTEMDLDEVFENIQQHWPGSHSVSLTGGEPLVQADFIAELLPTLKSAGMQVHLETNGILPEQLKKVIEQIDVVAMDLKLPSSTKCEPFWNEHKAFLEVAQSAEVFIKAVISADTQAADIHASVELVKAVNPDTLFILQPNTFDLGKGIMQKCQDFETYCSSHLNNVRILPQMHKIMKVR